MFQFQKTFLMLSFLLIPFVSSAQLSASKLSAHLIGDYTAGSSNIVAGQPRSYSSPLWRFFAQDRGGFFVLVFSG